MYKSCQSLNPLFLKFQYINVMREIVTHLSFIEYDIFEYCICIMTGGGIYREI